MRMNMSVIPNREMQRGHHFILDLIPENPDTSPWPVYLGDFFGALPIRTVLQYTLATGVDLAMTYTKNARQQGMPFTLNPKLVRLGLGLDWA